MVERVAESEKKAERLTKAEVRKRVDRWWWSLQRLCDSSSDADRYLERARTAALAGEKRHRTGAPLGAADGHRYRQPVETTARYFVCMWFACQTEVRSALEAVQLREDCLYATAARLEMEGRRRSETLGVVRSMNTEGLGSLDYADDFVGPRGGEETAE